MTVARSPRLARGLVLLTVFAAGCGAADMAPVAGTVKYEDGSPVTGGEVVLHPADDPKLSSPVGYIQPDGSVTLFTESPGDGVKVGRYKVSVASPTDDYGPRNPRPIDPRFADPATSGLEFEVKAGPNTLTLTVHRPGKGGKK